MKAKLTLMILLFLLCKPTICQSTYNDSLLNTFDTISSHADRYTYSLNKDRDYNLTLEQKKEWYKIAYKEAAYLGDLLKALQIYTSAASLFAQHGKYEIAADCIAKAKEFPINELGTDADISVKQSEYSYYSDIGEYEIAAEKLETVVAIYHERNDSSRIAAFSHNLAICYNKMGESEKAIALLKEAYAINVALDHHYQFYNLGMLANVYAGLGQYELALENFHLSLENARENQDSYAVAANQINIASQLIELNRTKEAYALLDTAIAISEDKQFDQWKLNALSAYYKGYEQSKDYKKAFEYLSKHREMEKEMLNESSINQLANAQKEIDDKNIEMLKNESLANQLIIDQQQIENEKKNLMLYFSMGIGVLFIVLLIFIWRGYLIKKKANSVILNQKKLVEIKNEEILLQKNNLQEKNIEILDSITYAKRIQSAILPASEVIKKHLPNSFVLYKPKDIVAGDFYWMQPYGDSSKGNGVLFAVADCTGHGVPGAMVSVVCNNALNRSVREYGLELPGEILNKTREIVLEEFEKSEDKVNDGMDIALCSLKKNILHYSGANNPLWIIRKGSSEVEEIKASKQPIGEFHNSSEFETHKLVLQEGDSVYIFSDGYVDQFGGEKGKKFKAKTFKDLLLKIQDRSMTEQQEILDQEIEKWKGELEQIDDICILGLRA